MPSNKLCGLCHEVGGSSINIESKKYAKLVESKRNIIYQTLNFCVVPSFGALHETHVLIVPRKHVFSMAQIAENWTELNAIKQKIQSFVLEKCGNNVVFFEHGTGLREDTSGGCIDHAHLHSIESNAEFNKSVLSVIASKNFQKSNLSFANVEEGYLYFQDVFQSEWIVNTPRLPSQFFRQLYSKSNINVKVWNWRNHMNIGMIENVLRFYKEF